MNMIDSVFCRINTEYLLSLRESLFLLLLSQKGTEAVLEFDMAGRFRSRVLGRHLAERLLVRPWVCAGVMVVSVPVPQHFQFLTVGAIPDAEVLVRISLSAAASLSAPPFLPTRSGRLYRSQE